MSLTTHLPGNNVPCSQLLKAGPAFLIKQCKTSIHWTLNFWSTLWYPSNLPIKCQILREVDHKEGCSNVKFFLKMPRGKEFLSKHNSKKTVKLSKL